MSHNTLIRPGGWVGGSNLLQTEMALFDTAQYQSINGDLGGTWAPSSTIVIGGQGLQITGTLDINNSLTKFETGAQIQLLGTANQQFMNGTQAGFNNGSQCFFKSGSTLTIGGTASANVTNTASVNFANSATMNFNNTSSAGFFNSSFLGFNNSAGGPARVFPGGAVLSASGNNPPHQESTELVALGCTRCANCERGRGCPFGLTTTDPELSRLVDPDWGAERVSRVYASFQREIAGILRRLGMRSVRELRGRTEVLVYVG